jgi:hypothetical protein
MANVFIENATLQNIANAIRNKTGKTEKMLPAEMPAEIESIETGGGDNYYDTFWDSYQQNGNRTDYYGAFSRYGWNDVTFKPKYDIAPTNAHDMFLQCNIVDLETAMGDKKFDFSKMQVGTSVFNSASKLKVIPILNNTNSYSSWFRGCSALETIRKIISTENTDYTNAFVGCSKLANITFEGVIGRDISFISSPLLSVESINSIIGCLNDLTGQTAKTLTFHNTVGSNLTDTQKATITAKNWALVY